MIIDIYGVMKMLIQSFTRLVGIGSKSEDMHGASRTRQRAASAVTPVRFCKTFLVSGGFSTHACDSGVKKKQITSFINEKRTECVLVKQQ